MGPYCILLLHFLTATPAGAQQPQAARPKFPYQVLARALARTWDFETGDLRGWTPTGQAFNSQPTYGDNPAARGREPAGQQGKYWIGTYERYQGPDSTTAAYRLSRIPPRPGAIQGDAPQGILTSPDFTVATDSVSFLVGGGASQDTRVELIVVEPGIDITTRQVYSASGQNSETMRRVAWDLRTYRGRTARIRIVDAATGPWGHINADDFRFFNGVVPPAPKYTVVPDLSGQDSTHAAILLAGRNLVLGSIDSIESSTQPGLVVWQNPPPNANDTVGAAVAIRIAKAPPPTGVLVPDVLRQTAESAQVLIENAGLTLGEVRRIATDSLAPGVIQQSPVRGTRVTPRARVDLVVAVAIVPARVAVPGVIGDSVSIAVARIKAAGLLPGTVSGSGRRGGIVSGQSPNGGDSAAVGSAVDLTVAAAGPPLATVPGLLGRTRQSAESELKAVRLRPGSITFVMSSNDPGTVTGQSPSPGDQVPEGSPVHLYLAAARPGPPIWLKVAAIVVGATLVGSLVWKVTRPKPPSPRLPALSARPGATQGRPESAAASAPEPGFEIRFRAGVPPGMLAAETDRGTIVDERRES